VPSTGPINLNCSQSVTKASD